MINERSLDEFLTQYRLKYGMLAPDEDSRFLAKELWQEWEKTGVTPPDIEKIAVEHDLHENGFFHDIVKVAEKLAGKKLQIHYCNFALDKYNCYALSVTDGYIVLIDDIFFQLLFFICLILIYAAQGLIDDTEKNDVKKTLLNIINYNYFEKKRYDFSSDQLLLNLLKKDYELTEFSNYFFHSLKAFIIAHEIGHHILLHTEGVITKEFQMNGNIVSIEVDERQIECEVNADKYAYQLLTQLYNTVDDTVSYAYCKFKFPFSPLFLFDLFYKLDQMQEIRTGLPIVYKTHPHPLERIKSLTNQFSIDHEDFIYKYLKEAMEEYMS